MTPTSASSKALAGSRVVAAGTPRALRRILSPEMKAFFLKEGAEPATMKPAEFETFIAAEIERWKQVAKAADIKPE